MRLQEISPRLYFGLISWLFERRDSANAWRKALSRLERSSYSLAMRNILLIIIILLLIGAFPGWGYSSGWGYYPFGGIGLVLLIVLILALTGRL